MTPREAIQQYDAALVDYRQAMENLSMAQASALTNKRLMDDIEAEVVVNGGHADITIDGKNAETRQAQLAVALAKHDSYVKVMKAQRLSALQVIDLEADRDAAAETMRFARTVLAYETAVANRDAYAHGAAK